MTLSSSRGNGAVPRKVPFARALQRFYWERRRNVYTRLSFNYDERMNIRDKLHGIGSDTAWEVLLTRKPEKYEKWI